MSSPSLEERLDEAREEGRRLLTLAYSSEPPPAWPLRDVAAPLVLELLDIAREALERGVRP